ncbi:altronate oxidoreductase [Actinoplanes sp. OR16]|nr:tagaturonate reductase [Actinoplanes sp. OR16]BBH70336.1 altronate oxidoreductase [Actinoplanes sp. OR16]
MGASTVERGLVIERQLRPVRVLQIGAGNFLRGFADWMIQKGNASGVLDHGVVVFKVTPSSSVVTAEPFRVVLDGVRDGEAFTEVTDVDVIQEAVDAYTDWERCLAVMRGGDLRLVVSNTTEAGIVVVDGEDLTATPPASFPAKIAVLLHERWRHFAGDPDRGLLFLPCELTEDNGRALRQAVLHHAAVLGADFAAWVGQACRFYDTIVDRIVPGRDAEGVRGEHYALWAIAGDAVLRREFPLDRAGLPLEFVPEIRVFREKKVRILNGSHTALAAVAPLLGCTTVADAVRHPIAREYLRRLLDDEVLPTLPDDAPAFAAATMERFGNPALDHRLADIALNALSKWQTRNLPVVLDRWAAGEGAPLTVFALACLLLGRAGEFQDYPVRDTSHPSFADDHPRLAAEIDEHVRAIREAGPVAALEKVIQ